MPRATPLLVFAALALLGSIAYACPDSATTRASYYGPGFNGRRTASGQVFRAYQYTAAHRTWRFGTQVRVTNLRNGRNVVVTITDRGPYVRGRSLDLSVGAAQALGATGTGVVPVRLEPLCQVASLKARS
jgi:rare lipoprotein A